LEDIINGYYTTPTQKEFQDKCNQVLKDNGIFTLEDWRKLTEEDKDKDGYPRGLRIVLDDALGNSQIQIHNLMARTQMKLLSFLSRIMI
jgi:hypothetical protein